MKDDLKRHVAVLQIKEWLRLKRAYRMVQCPFFIRHVRTSVGVGVQIDADIFMDIVSHKDEYCKDVVGNYVGGRCKSKSRECPCTVIGMEEVVSRARSYVISKA